jgi:archaellum component FlaC
MENLESTKQEILEAIHVFAGSVDERFDKVDQRFNGIETDIGSMKQEVGSMKQEMGSMKQEMGSMKAQMVTKDYLDEKISDLRGDLVVLVRKGDHKVVALVGNLENKGILTKEEAQKILAMEPYPQLSL